MKIKTLIPLTIFLALAIMAAIFAIAIKKLRSTTTKENKNEALDSVGINNELKANCDISVDESNAIEAPQDQKINLDYDEIEVAERDAYNVLTCYDANQMWRDTKSKLQTKIFLAIVYISNRDQYINFNCIFFPGDKKIVINNFDHISSVIREVENREEVKTMIKNSVIRNKCKEGDKKMLLDIRAQVVSEYFVRGNIDPVGPAIIQIAQEAQKINPKTTTTLGLTFVQILSMTITDYFPYFVHSNIEHCPKKNISDGIAPNWVQKVEEHVQLLLPFLEQDQVATRNLAAKNIVNLSISLLCSKNFSDKVSARKVINFMAEQIAKNFNKYSTIASIFQSINAGIQNIEIDKNSSPIFNMLKKSTKVLSEVSHTLAKDSVYFTPLNALSAQSNDQKRSIISANAREILIELRIILAIIISSNLKERFDTIACNALSEIIENVMNTTSTSSGTEDEMEEYHHPELGNNRVSANFDSDIETLSILPEIAIQP